MLVDLSVCLWVSLIIAFQCNDQTRVDYFVFWVNQCNDQINFLMPDYLYYSLFITAPSLRRDVIKGWQFSSPSPSPPSPPSSPVI